LPSTDLTEPDLSEEDDGYENVLFRWRWQKHLQWKTYIGHLCRETSQNMREAAALGNRTQD